MLAKESFITYLKGFISGILSSLFAGILIYSFINGQYTKNLIWLALILLAGVSMHFLFQLVKYDVYPGIKYLIDSLTDPMYFADQKQNIKYYNKEFASFMDVDKSFFIGKSIKDLIDHAAQFVPDSKREEFLKEQKSFFERRKRGEMDYAHTKVVLDTRKIPNIKENKIIECEVHSYIIYQRDKKAPLGYIVMVNNIESKNSFDSTTYKGAKIHQEWYARIIYQEGEINLCRMTINQSEQNITGEAVCVEGYSKGNRYTLKGTFNGRYLSYLYEGADPTMIDRGAFVLEYLGDGKSMKGFLIYYDDNKNKECLDAVPCEWIRDKHQYKKWRSEITAG
jgi:hypothetical protein